MVLYRRIHEATSDYLPKESIDIPTDLGRMARGLVHETAPLSMINRSIHLPIQHIPGLPIAHVYVYVYVYVPARIISPRELLQLQRYIPKGPTLGKTPYIPPILRPLYGSFPLRFSASAPRGTHGEFSAYPSPYYLEGIVGSG